MELPSGLVKARLRRGDILHSEQIEGIDHGKFFAVIAVTEIEVVGYFFINSIIHPMLDGKPELLQLQYRLAQADYTFLRYDSWLCASSLKKIRLDELVIQLQDGKAKIIDRLTPTDLEEVLKRVRASKIYSPKDKKLFFS